MRTPATQKCHLSVPAHAEPWTSTAMACGLLACLVNGACAEPSARPAAEPSAPVEVRPSRPEERPSASLDPRNADLPDVCTGGPGRLAAKAGTGSYDSKLGEGMQGSFEVTSLGKVDLDADGTEEILALVLCQPGGSGTHDAVWAFRAVGGRLERVARIDGGDRADGGLAHVELRANKIAIERNAGGESLCCADRTVNELWGFTSNGFVMEQRTPTTSPAQDLAADLLAGRQQLGWSATKNQIAYAVTVAEEGSGTVAWNVGLLDLKTNKEVDRIELCGTAASPGCSEAELAARVPDLAKRLDGFVPLAGTEARPGEAATVGADLAVTQEKANLMISKPGASGKKSRLAKLKEGRHHKPEVTRVWYVPEARAVVVRILMNPGARYGELNVFEETRAFVLPPGL